MQARPRFRAMELSKHGRPSSCCVVLFLKQDTSWNNDYSYREFWRLENAYDDFKDRSKTGEVLPYSNYPMQIETGQVFVIDYTKKDGAVVRMYYRSDGYVWSGMKSTEEFTVE